jgi:hypothetical protein
MSEARAKTVMRALIAAQDGVESNRAVKPAIVRVLMDEIIRLRRMVQAQDNKLRKQEAVDGMEVHGSGNSQGPATGEGRFVRWQGEDVDPIDG